MVQVELDNCTNGSIQITKKAYTISDVQKLVKPITSSKQISFPKGRMFCSYKAPVEIEWVMRAILDALNHPEKFDCPGDNFGATMKLQEMIKGNNCIVLKEKYGLPMKLEYRNTFGVNSIVDVNHEDKIIIPLTARETLNTVADFIKKRDVKAIYEAGLDYWYHEELTIEHLELLRKLYFKGKLNNLLGYICEKSSKIEGFKDYREDYVDVIKNEVRSRYVYDYRRYVKVEVK